jgi:hypothetical protein
MIHLDFTPPDDAAWRAWVQEGRAAAEKLLADAGGQRAIDAALYKRQRDRLLAATHQKCAYCELSLTVGQRKGDVEHYRPKGAVRRLDGKVVKVLRDGVEIDHPGYYWLAYDFHNLLPACIACNRRAGDAASGTNTGKSDIFPTLDDHWAARPEEVPAEQPALLNPWLDNPAEHLVFDPDTGVVAGITERGRITVRLLGLNRDGLPEQRKKACEDVRRTVQISIGDAARDDVRPADLSTLLAVKDGSAEYAAACRVAARRARQKVAELLESFDEQAPAPSRPSILYVSIEVTDEQGIAAGAAGRPGGDEDPGAQARTLKAAVVFTETLTDEAGLPVRDPASATYVASFGTDAEFGALVAAEVRRRDAVGGRQLVILGDGGAWAWTLAAEHFPRAVQMVDPRSARRRLQELARLLEFMLGDRKEEWLAQRLAELDGGEASAISAAVRAFPLADWTADIRAAVSYFEDNARRMQYARFRSSGMFMGPGNG